ncbi:MAG: hypothetical protein GQ522_07025 [Deltaproteobacteria bacterium]|nr:hypothetical protein [Deltaproteobacteria bacterium]
MRIISIILLIMIGAFAFNITCPATSSAHSDGHRGTAIKESEAVAVALKHVKLLLKKGKIEKSWEEVDEGTGKLKQFGKSQEWVVIIKNSKAKDPAKRTLYFFLTLQGKYIAANFTGK